MLLNEYLANRPRGFKTAFAIKIGISTSFLRQLETGYSKMPHYIAQRIDDETCGKVSKAELRPDLWD